jgi:hypothetical protein
MPIPGTSTPKVETLFREAVFFPSFYCGRGIACPGAGEFGREIRSTLRRDREVKIGFAGRDVKVHVLGQPVAAGGDDEQHQL